MGGAVSSGRDNNELIDNLMGGNYIRTVAVERVFRALDRADYMTPEARDQAYKDLAWRDHLLHMSAPCIYSEVMEGLELKPGLSFLNVGSGTGYLSTLVGLILGCGGINHGVEIYPGVLEYANKKLSQFVENSATLDEFDFCEPKFFSGNGLCLAPLQSPYDRVYCGAGCPDEYQNYFKQLIKVDGILVMPLNDNLLQVRRVSADEWTSQVLLHVSFAPLRMPTKEEATNLIKLEEQAPPKLQLLARSVIRTAMRRGLLRRHPELREVRTRQPPAKKSCPRRICIPIEDDSDVEGLNALHDLDREGGAHEMNALLSLVLNMGENRVAGALRFSTGDSSDSSSDEGDDGDENDDDDDGDEDGDDDEDGGGRGRLDFSFNGPTEIPEENSFLSKDGDVAAEDAPAPPSRLVDQTRDPKDAGDRPSGASTSSREDGESESGDTKHPGSGDSRKRSAEREDVPAEVEILLGKTSDSAPGTSRGRTRWDRDDGGAPTETAHESSEEETEGSAGEKEKQKFDSGIGEENTPSCDSSPTKTDSKTDDSDGGDRSNRSDSLMDEADDTEEGWKRLKRRNTMAGRSSSSTEESAGGESLGRRGKRRAGEGGDARRVRLSILMKRGVRELPLPYALKKYVNWGRCFEF